MLVVACGGIQTGDKAGGKAPPVTLQMGTRDGLQHPGARAVRAFGLLVDELSGGRLRIEPVFNAHGNEVHGWDAAIARRVAAGDLDLAIVATTAWEGDAAGGLTALHAPFLVGSDRLVERIVAPEFAADLLSDLDAIGVRGLALLPRSLRHPFSFDEPLRAPADYEGRAIQVSEGADVVADALRALGARPRAFGPAELREAARTGSVAGAESSFLEAGGLPLTATATGNVVLYAGMDVIVIGHGALAVLDEHLVEVVREAASRMPTWALREDLSDVEAAARFCEAGGSVALASESDLAALDASVRPVYQELLRDARVAEIVARIRSLQRQLPPAAAIEPCGPPG
jgi:TRAP-type C4-dicarboxylate transport system substrate-binding protein